jgi:hypothetical protein
MNMNWFLETCSRRCPQKAGVDGNKTSLTPSMIAIYFTESLIFRLLYIGPSARQKSRFFQQYLTGFDCCIIWAQHGHNTPCCAHVVNLIFPIFNTPSSLSLKSLLDSFHDCHLFYWVFNLQSSIYWTISKTNIRVRIQKHPLDITCLSFTKSILPTILNTLSSLSLTSPLWNLAVNC